MRYIVFDVETPNHRNNRISAIGITVLEENRIVKEWYSLVNPEAEFDNFNIRLTGITSSMVQDAPTFPELWQKIGPVMTDGILVAHNAVFDLGVLKCCLGDYNIAWKSKTDYLCTVQMGRRLLPGMKHKLDILCDYYGIPLDHHHAGSDSRACAEILLRYMEHGTDMTHYIRTYSLQDGRRSGEDRWTKLMQDDWGSGKDKRTESLQDGRKPGENGCDSRTESMRNRRERSRQMADFTYEIVEEVGVLSEGTRGWRKELNKISWNGGPVKYDIRDWAPDHSKMGKGVTLTEEEARQLKELL